MPCSKAIVQVAGGTGGEGGGGIGDGGGGDPTHAHDCPPPLLPPPPLPPLLPPPLLPPLLWLWLLPPVLGPPKRRRPCFLLWLFVRFFPLDDLLLCLLRLRELTVRMGPRRVCGADADEAVCAVARRARLEVGLGAPRQLQQQEAEAEQPVDAHLLHARLIA